MATKKIGVEIAVALAEMTPQTNIAARNQRKPGNVHGVISDRSLS